MFVASRVFASCNEMGYREQNLLTVFDPEANICESCWRLRDQKFSACV